MGILDDLYEWNQRRKPIKEYVPREILYKADSAEFEAHVSFENAYYNNFNACNLTELEMLTVDPNCAPIEFLWVCLSRLKQICNQQQKQINELNEKNSVSDGITYLFVC